MLYELKKIVIMKQIILDSGQAYYTRISFRAVDALLKIEALNERLDT